MSQSSKPISAESITLRFGIGCFETIKVFPELRRGFKVAFLQPHVRRLLKGAMVCRLTAPSEESIEREIYACLKEGVSNRVQVLRLMLTQETGLHCWLQPAESYTESIRACSLTDFCINSSSPLNSFKSFNYLHNYLAGRQATDAGFDAAVLFNEKGQLAELHKANLFFLTLSGQWVTPDLSSGCLPGIIRETLIPFLKADERPIEKAELQSFRSVIAVNSLVEVQNVSQIDNLNFEPVELKPLIDHIRQQM